MSSKKQDTPEHRVFDDQSARDRRGIENAALLFRGILSGKVQAARPGRFRASRRKRSS